ncbi:MAG: M28 family peptidase [Bacteroidia bacterium]|nr:M28 family peptidase [Bacteroidia bacterium]
MKYSSFLACLVVLLMPLPGSGQTNHPEDHLTRAEVAAHMRFLASDELAGRRTGSQGIEIAAKYLASHFAALGLQPAPGMDSYFQAVPYEEVTPPSMGSVECEGKIFTHGDNMLFLKASPVNDSKVKYVFAGYGQKTSETNDYEGLDVKGKVVVTFLGLPGEENPNVIFSSITDKRKWAKEEGAIGLIELYRLRFPWGFVSKYFNKSRIQLADEEEAGGEFFYGWIRDEGGAFGEEIAAKAKGKMGVNCDGSVRRTFSSPNVIAYLPGTDSALRDQFVILSSHYDHVGVGAQGGGSYTAEDSIFNGARDNAFGTVSVLAAAKALSAEPVRRSILFICYSGEEVGLLGSEYYAAHPVVPLNQTVFNLNTDGAGYSETDAVSIFGYGRMDTDGQLDQGAAAFGLRVIGNPAPEQGLFDRSDNVSLAIKGVPAPTFSPGFSSFNSEINKYYHQVTDNPETIDFDYLKVYCQAYAYTARLIANRDKAPTWNEGDKYAPAGAALYGQ